MTVEHAFEDCGTYAAYQRHKKRGIPIDDDCKAALREYMREYRENHPDTLKRDRRVATARSRALTRLANAHPGEYSRLLREERQRVLGSNGARA